MVFPFAKEQAVFVPGPSGQLEAMIHAPDDEGVFSERRAIAIICHPHPQHGGTMDNKVVTTLMRVYRDLGIAVVRFNFRGVGRSEGQFDNAIGEQDDLLAMVAWLNQQFPDAPLLLTGFSFGSSIAAQVSYEVARLLHLALIAPPVERYPYARNGKFNCPLCVVQGGKDERVVASGVYDWAASLQSDVELIRYPEAGHFFHGYLTALKVDLSAAIERQLTEVV
ncbi:alpha/beta hydrolase [Cellvibrio fontiphilus]|uniref:Alpha/beta hydrolase n=1 Tax=Cellvibrio fontiphilus TaxID=1815559 RepID=A0ABV7FHU5_9GAMM